jgi:hypothetical protein
MTSDIHYHGVWRMDWGLGNPNKTATLIAMLMMAVWAISYVRRWGFWVSLTLFTGLGVCLVHTLSRGGVVAALAGPFILIWQAPRPWPRRRVLAGLLALGLLAGASVYLQAHQRYGQGIASEDRSVTNRLKIWKHVPQMMADAPNGWGHHQAQEAYMQWYQDVDAPETYLNLINTHFTWLVEMGWLGRFAYVAGWGIIFLLCWPNEFARWRSVPLAIWLALATGASFTHVADSTWMWTLPAASLILVLLARAMTRDWPPLRQWAAAGLPALVLLIATFTMGALHSNDVIRGSRDGVILGRGEPAIWIVARREIMGEQYGKTLRRHLRSQTQGPAVGVVIGPASIPMSSACAIAAGGTLSIEDLHELTRRTQAGARLVLLNPAFYPQEIAEAQSVVTRVSCIFGEYSQSAARSAWSDLKSAQTIEAVGDFLPAWPELLLSPES